MRYYERKTSFRLKPMAFIAGEVIHNDIATYSIPFMGGGGGGSGFKFYFDRFSDEQVPSIQFLLKYFISQR